MMRKKLMAGLITSMFLAILFANIVYGNDILTRPSTPEDVIPKPDEYNNYLQISGGDNDHNFENPPLPRYREGGTPYDPPKTLHPYAICCRNPEEKILSGLIESPPEYSPTNGVIYWYSSSAWAPVVRDLVVALTQDDTHDEIAYVVVTSASQQSQATNQFSSGGANMSKVQFIIEPGNAIWIRDYGPHFIWQDGALALVDSHYYPTRPLDNFLPTLLGDDHFIIPTYDMGLYYSGGNFQPGPNRTGFITELTYTDNPASQGFNESFIAQLFSQYQGIDTLHVMPQLPPSVDGTGHIDMWMYIVDEDSVIISEFEPGSDPTAITITNNAVTYMQNLGFTVHRTPAWNAAHPSNGYNTHWTYTNAFRVNNRIFIPTFGETYTPYADEDADALTAFQAAVDPSVEVVPIDCYDIIWASGAIHCIVMQVPEYRDLSPSVHVINPNGGDFLAAGTTATISWAATDTNNSPLSQIDLYFSSDGGDTFSHIASISDTGYYDWTVPNIQTDQGLIKVVAVSSDSDQGEDVSDTVFKIAYAQQTTYDFSTGGGTDKYGWGHQTASWSSVDGNPFPVTTEISSLVANAYSKIAFSDATGGDTDSNRYTSPDPTNYFESTHVFEFTITEDPSLIDDISILWEGYGDQCAQVELYIWDYIEGQWGNGHGLYGQNYFMDNWAGNRDGYLESHIRSNFSRYINPSGQMLLLVYEERGPDGVYVTYCPSFHDYISVVVSEISSIPEITNVVATPLIQDVGEWVNISCDVFAAEGIQTVNAVVTYPDNTTVNQTMIVPPAGTGYFYNTSYSLPGNYTFYVWASDMEGNGNISAVSWFRIENLVHSYNLSQGWNLVTVPVETDWTAESLGINISGCTLVLRFDANTQSFLTHVVGTPWDDFPIHDGVAYFVYVASESTLVSSGFSIPSVAVSVYSEWNLLGWYHEYESTAESLGENISGCTLVIMFDAPTQSFLTHVVGTPWDNFSILKGMGMFIYTNEGSVWQGEG